MMMNSPAIILAEHEDFGRVIKCECGAIHLEIGSLRVSFSPDAYVSFADLVNAAIPRLVQLAAKFSV
jgi:hypothetical protein